MTHHSRTLLSRLNLRQQIRRCLHLIKLETAATESPTGTKNNGAKKRRASSRCSGRIRTETRNTKHKRSMALNVIMSHTRSVAVSRTEIKRVKIVYHSTDDGASCDTLKPWILEFTKGLRPGQKAIVDRTIDRLEGCSLSKATGVTRLTYSGRIT